MELRRGRRVVTVHHPEQLWWPDAGLRKRDAIDYYLAVAPVLLPHLRGRPFTLKRHYNGPRSPFEWVKDAPPEMPAWIGVCPLPAKSRGGGEVRYPVVSDELALAWMVDFGCVDLHLWYSRCDRPDNPDYVLFDIDPIERATFADVVGVAQLLRNALDVLELESFVKTSGATGVHVLVPVARCYSYADTRRFSELVTLALRRAHGRLPARIDTKLNGRGMTVASVYSVRPLREAPVSTPVTWDELEGLDPQQLTMQVVLERVERLGDLFDPVLRLRQRLAPRQGMF
jgi:bifunctional non-homologous end joining protein LigD